MAASPDDVPWWSARRLGRWVGLIAIVVLVSTGREHYRRWDASRTAAALPVLLGVPAFELVDETGRKFGSRELAGKVYIASFLFTTCGQVCPRLAATVAGLQKKLAVSGGAALLVSFSVDPTRDTPEQLTKYARAHGAQPHLWKFLTGPLGTVEQAVVQGFKQPMNRTAIGKNGFFDIVHGERLVLVDGRGQIRGFYEAKEDAEQGLKELLRDTAALLTASDTRSLAGTWRTP